jgi:hypothetical protein
MKKTILIIVCVVIAFKVLDRLFLNKNVWSLIPENFEG